MHFRGTSRRRAKKDDVWDFISVKRGNWRGEGNISESAIRSPGVRRNEVNAYVTLSLLDDRKTEADP